MWHEAITLLPAKLWGMEYRVDVRRALSSRPCRAPRRFYTAGTCYPFRSTIRTAPLSLLCAPPASVAPPMSSPDWYFGRPDTSSCKFRFPGVQSCFVRRLVELRVSTLRQNQTKWFEMIRSIVGWTKKIHVLTSLPGGRPVTLGTNSCCAV